jgi:hypothetical protein
MSEHNYRSLSHPVWPESKDTRASAKTQASQLRSQRIRLVTLVQFPNLPYLIDLSPRPFHTRCILGIRAFQIVKPPLAPWLGLSTRTTPTGVGLWYLTPFPPRA